jgi:hypothetical protein
MTNRFSSPLNPFGAPEQTAIYRPKYKPRVGNPKYALDGTLEAESPEVPGLLDALHALEEWRRQEVDNRQDPAPRWRPEKTRSLFVYITPLNKPQWQDIILRACREWEFSSGGLIQFVHTVRPEEADIKVEWSQTAVVGRDYEVGHTRNTVHPPNWITQATLTLLVQPEIDKHLTLDQIQSRLYTTALHELGHALGLEHSQSARDVMHHQGWKNPVLTKNDIRQLTELYTKPISTLFLL